ncbi:hypothetical protein C8F01DRAFT_574527 [Mycena amicta]|nr:hypothetical protein C8F01DRAFT_574527 [Mycena amicta]
MGRRLQTCEQTRSRDAARFSTSAKTNDTSCVRQSTHVAEPPSSTVATQTALPAHTSSSPLVSSRSFLPSPPTSSAPFHTLARRPGHRIAVLLHESENIPAFARRTSSDMVGRRTVVRALPELQPGSFECGQRREHMEYRTTPSRTTRDGGFHHSEGAWVVLSVDGCVPHALSRSLASLEGCRGDCRRIAFRRLRVAFCCVLDPLDPSRGSPIVSSATASIATGAFFPCTFDDEDV